MSVDTMSENPIELINQWEKVKDKLEKIEAEKDDLREKFAKLMHLWKKNEATIESASGRNWNMAYQEKNSRKTNYDLLLAESRDLYDKVVSETASTSFIIREVKKKKRDQNETNTAPVQSLPKVPEGVIF